MTARVLVTGGSGFIGRQVVERLAREPGVERVVSVDVVPGPDAIHSVEMDIRDPALGGLLADEGIDRIVHLAAIVTPQPHHIREFLESVDVGGTRNVTAAALEAGVTHLTVMSSGAAYGYRADNPTWIEEDLPLRGNEAFAYADHKRRVEEDLARLRIEHPELVQLILRPGTILGETVDNQITALWEWPVLLGVSGSETPFVFIWDADVVAVVVAGTLGTKGGIYNLAGDGAVTLAQIATELGRPRVVIPAGLIRAALAVLNRLGLTAYGPEQVDFLRYRPVLSNQRLISEFGYRPEKTSLEAFRAWATSHG